MSVPSLARLQAGAAEPFWLVGPSGERCPARLHAALPGVPVNTQHCCYAARFALPPGVRALQALYRVESHGDAWDLLLTPLAPLADGSGVLEAVFHYRIQADAGQSSA
ncbi:hypothetical protein [Rhizobacter sp. SG703]|uniref:hypothetical protein n=1 Tax=Rhizobacter sp. SG703 TaxID=2587140 RepID=UPI001446D618|nr:hypothetical protein [Rhizobacter sp. SG703]NKI96182.1 hypothetical protein [Rhizobacter sp. SG703]